MSKWDDERLKTKYFARRVMLSIFLIADALAKFFWRGRGNVPRPVNGHIYNPLPHARLAQLTHGGFDFGEFGHETNYTRNKKTLADFT